MSTQTHWHVASGLAGYGPDSADGWTTAYSATDAANCAADELRTWIDIAHETAAGLAQSAEEGYQRLSTDDPKHQGYQWYSVADMFRASVQESHRADSLAILAANLDAAKRASAPMFADDPEALERAMRTIIDGYTDTAGNAHSGAPWDVSDNQRLYVWQCNESECLEDEG